MSTTKIVLGVLLAIALQSGSAMGLSKAKRAREFSCSEVCAQKIKDCVTLQKCYDPSNKCLEKGSVKSQLKGRQSAILQQLLSAKRTEKGLHCMDLIGALNSEQKKARSHPPGESKEQIEKKIKSIQKDIDILKF